ncbi:hypothetical protein KW797_04835 [Candidatus Parcubacteria bacterium]|nr:hypothetical protein [Candidatus Parcubacteria bacterium]
MQTQMAIDRSVMLLKWAFGLTLILIGLDKVLGTNIIVEWAKYVGPLAQAVLPIAPATLVLVLGAAEIVVGIMMLTRWTQIAAYISIAVLALIVVNLFSLGMYDIAARDVLLALSLLVLTWLIGARRA